MVCPAGEKKNPLVWKLTEEKLHNFLTKQSFTVCFFFNIGVFFMLFVHLIFLKPIHLLKLNYTFCTRYIIPLPVLLSEPQIILTEEINQRLVQPHTQNRHIIKKVAQDLMTFWLSPKLDTTIAVANLLCFFTPHIAFASWYLIRISLLQLVFTLSCFITVHHPYKESGSLYPLMMQLKTAVTLLPMPPISKAEQI